MKCRKQSGGGDKYYEDAFDDSHEKYENPVSIVQK
jgi:hypothetical protein